MSPSCCYFVVVIYLQKQSDEMSEARVFARELLEEKVFFFLEMIWHSHGVQQSAGPALQTEGERGRAICGTDMVDVAQLVCFCLE